MLIELLLVVRQVYTQTEWTGNSVYCHSDVLPVSMGQDKDKVSRTRVRPRERTTRHQVTITWGRLGVGTEEGMCFLLAPGTIT